MRNAIAKNDYQDRGCDITADEIFVSDGAKCDSGNIQEIFAKDNKIAVCDPVYPVYVDTNVMAGQNRNLRSEDRDMERCDLYAMYKRERILHRNCQRKHRILFICVSRITRPDLPSQKHQLQEWVDYANKVGAVIIYDAAYEAYISEDNVPHSIYECEGARTCAIELRSFLQRMQDLPEYVLGYTVIPKESERQEM